MGIRSSWGGRRYPAPSSVTTAIASTETIFSTRPSGPWASQAKNPSKAKVYPGRMRRSAPGDGCPFGLPVRSGPVSWAKRRRDARSPTSPGATSFCIHRRWARSTPWPRTPASWRIGRCGVPARSSPVSPGPVPELRLKSPGSITFPTARHPPGKAGVHVGILVQEAVSNPAPCSVTGAYSAPVRCWSGGRGVVLSPLVARISLATVLSPVQLIILGASRNVRSKPCLA